MSSYPPLQPPPYGPPGGDWRYQRQLAKEQARAQRDMMRAQRAAHQLRLRGMRRGSIAGPLLVVAVGIIFLLAQLGKFSLHRVWEWYGRWWPLLLVAIGVILLVEWALDQARQRNAEPSQLVPRRVLGSGLVTLIVLLVGAGIALSSVHSGDRNFFGRGFTINSDDLNEFLGDKHESDHAAVQSLSDGMGVTISNPRGDVTVSGTSEDNQVHILTHREVYTRSDAEADNKAQQLTPIMATSNGGVSITVPTVDGSTAGLTITVPAKAAVTINANHGDVKVGGIKAPVNITANHGDVTLSAITGDTSAHINNGDSSFSAHSITGLVRVEGRGHDLTISDVTGPVSMNGEFFGTTHLERITGGMRFHTSRTDFQLARLDGEVEISPNADLSADRAVGPVTLNTRNRNITMERMAGDMTITNRNGSVDLTSAPPMGNVSVENRNGSVNLTVPNDASFSVQAQTTNGELENEFSLKTEGDDTHKSFTGMIGNGGKLVHISTSQGDIALKKASVAPLPPTPPPPPPLTFAPQDETEAIRAGHEAAAEARRDAEDAAREAKREAAEAARDARQQAAEAKREAAEAAAEARRDAAAAKREAEGR